MGNKWTKILGETRPPGNGCLGIMEVVVFNEELHNFLAVLGALLEP